MATQATITLNTVPYVPSGTNGNVAAWRNLQDPNMKGLTTLRESVNGPSKEGVFRVRWKLDLPKVAEDASPCACPGDVQSTGMIDIVMIVPASWTAANRTDFRTRIQNLVTNAAFVASVDNLEGSW